MTSKTARGPRHSARAYATAGFSLALFTGALVVLDRVLREYHPADIGKAVAALPMHLVVLSVALTVCGYLALVGYDAVALKYLKKSVPLRRVIIPAFTSYAVANSTPSSVITGGAVRYRLYGSMGLSGKETAAIAAFDVLTYVVGLFTIAGIAFVSAPITQLPGKWHLPPIRPLGIVLLALVAVYFLMAWRQPSRLRIRTWTLRFPSLRIAVMQAVVSAFDWVLSASALYVVMIAGGPLPFVRFLSGFLVAQIITLVTPIPGGLGVFEALILLLRPAAASAPVTLAALLVYRVVYYLIPLLAAAVILAFAEGRSGQRRPGLLSTMAPVAPYVMAALTFAAGATLLATGALPANPERVKWLTAVIPQGLMETSQFLSSLIGGMLLVLAWGLASRSDAAYLLTRTLLGVGVLLTLLRGLDVEAGIAIAFVLALLLPAHREFNRPSMLTSDVLSPDWLAAIVAVTFALAWLALFTHRHAVLTNQPWWRLAVEGDASRPIRAAVGVVVGAALLNLARLVRARRPQRKKQDPGPKTQDPGPRTKGRRGVPS